MYNGTLDGITYVKESGGWDFNGILYLCPRDSVDEFLNDDACEKNGVYLLLSNDKVYVGQSINLKKRIKQHLFTKDWWEKVILLTSENDSLNSLYITYLEHELIDRANQCGSLDCDNKTNGNKSFLNSQDVITLKIFEKYSRSKSRRLFSNCVLCKFLFCLAIKLLYILIFLFSILIEIATFKYYCRALL